MITSFKSLGQSGGGSGPVDVPIATTGRTGVVKIGQGINVDSAGTISVSGSDVANYAMALKSMDGEGDSLRVVNKSGWLYYIEEDKSDENDIFVKTTYDLYLVNINIDIDGQTDTDIINIGNSVFQFTISIDSEGNLYYINENDDDVYYDSAITEYQYGDFTFNWDNNGRHIGFSQQSDTIFITALTSNYENWYVIAQDIYIANQDQLGLVKIGEGIDLAEDGTISVSGGGGGIEVVTELPASGTDGQMVMLINSNEGGEEIVIRGTDTMDTAVTFTAKSITEQTKLWRYSYYNDSVGVSANTDGTLSIYSDYFNTGATISGDTSFVLDGRDGGGGENEITVTKVAEGEWIFANESPVERWEVYTDVIPPATEYKLYKWSDEETPSIDAVISNDGYMIEIFYDEIPTYTESAFTVSKMSVSEQAPQLYVEYRNGEFYNMEYGQENTPLIADGQIHIGAYDNTSYLISDGYIKFISNNGAIKFVDTDIWNGQMNATGWTEYGRNGVVYSGKNCYMDFPIRFNGGEPKYGGYGISNVYVPTEAGNNGQILKSNGSGVYWGDLKVQKIGLYNDLPVFGEEDEIGIKNIGISYTHSNAFLAANTTNPDEKNNFNDNTELSHIYNGSYIYFDCNGELTTSTAKTFLYRIAMRTNENGDWNTSELAYINVFREYDNVSQEHFYSWDMPPFDYKDDQGNDFTYSDSGIVDSSTTANTTEYLPLWKWWDGTYGYKFTFEYDNVADTLKVWLNHSSVDQIQGENYGDVNWECRNHTKEFCEYETDPTMSEVYVFKGGVWYKLGDLNQIGV